MANQNLSRTGARVFGAALLLAGAASAQTFTHNTTDVPLSGGATENVDFADIDLDGDWDAAFADGGDAGNDQNKIWQNQGGAQGGTVGIFISVTATQAPAITDDSRDIEFVDFDNDGDFDIYVSNTSQLTPINNSNRWWANMGGLQGGTIGFYQDQTSSRWVGLGGPGSSIASSQLGGNGGFIDFSCDCDFADLDNDGDIDLFHSTYGGAFGGQVPSRIFLNDGTGHFSEFNPSGFQLAGQNINSGDPGLWCQGTQTSETTNSTGANCDVASTALDIDLQDIDGDLDIDVLHGSRVTAPRMFKNRLQENGGTTLGFRDVTGATFTGSYWSGGDNYEQELGDFDNDGDIDIYGLNWPGLSDAVYKNNGNGTYAAGVTLSSSGSDDNEGDFIDYDEDGDLDLFVANFSGQDRMYNNNGSGTFTYQTTGTVLPSDGTTSLDADAADVDNDQDPDLFVANDAGQAEWYLKNGTTANDTFAPLLFRLEQAPNRTASPAPTIVRVQVEDNQPYYGTWYSTGRLDVTVNGGPVTSYTMRSSQGQIFRGEIPGALVGTICYTAVAIDRYGNTGQMGPLCYISSGAGSPGVSYCDPGLSGVTACPCGNPPISTGLGCDNSSFTGGAQLSSTGTASLSGDTVVLTAAGEKPTATSIFLQGDLNVPAGAVFGMGIRCVGGSLKRLYTKVAVAGSVTAPVGGDPTVSARSAALGDTITAGGTRYYMTYYRDPVVLGGCPAASTYNATQSQSVLWGL